MNVTVDQVQGLVRAVRQKAQGERERPLFGLRSDGKWSGPDEIDVDGHRYRVVQVDSPLQAHFEIVERDPDRRLVLITALREDELGTEILAKLSLHRLETVQPWQTVRELFRVSVLDSRLVREVWMADALCAVPNDQRTPPSGGVLDLEHAWGAVLRVVGLSTSKPELEEWVRWSSQSETVLHWRSWSDERKKATRDWARATAGEGADLVFAAIDAGYAVDIMSIGLVLDAIVGEGAALDPQATEARVRAERFFGTGRAVDATSAGEFAKAVVAVVERALGVRSVQAERWLQRADEILEHVLLNPQLAERSALLPSGRKHRLEAFAAALLRVVERPSAKGLEALDEARQRVLVHESLASGDAFAGTRLRADMATRLARWIATDENTSHRNLPDLARDYIRAGSFVDWARHVLFEGESEAVVVAAYRKLLVKVSERRERENKTFGAAVAASTNGWISGAPVMGVEHVLERVVNVLAQKAKVLLIVVDGMSQAVFQQLVRSIESRRGWRRHVPAEMDEWPVVLSALPSVTEVSRCSLLTGSLQVGKQDREIAGFNERATALGWRKPSAKARVLFHKADLAQTQANEEARELESQIESDEKVVAVVVNAVDDMLAKGDQIRIDWTLDTVGVLERLIGAAERERRAIVITSDHGHVVEMGTNDAIRTEESERWRSDSGETREGELRVSGARVLQPKVGGPCVLPWSERVRYVSRHAGYHGGVTPQEVLVPLAVLVPAGLNLDDWKVAQADEPPWWDLQRASSVSVIPEQRPPSKPVVQTGDLFAPPTERIKPSASWIERLLASAALKDQKSIAGRAQLKDEELRLLLAALDRQGGTLTSQALGSGLSWNAVQLNARLIAARRLLNVEGYGVLEVSGDDGTVRLSYELLEEQFQIRREDRS